MPSGWAVAADSWGRRSRGAAVRLGGLGEVDYDLYISMTEYSYATVLRYCMVWSVA